MNQTIESKIGLGLGLGPDPKPGNNLERQIKEKQQEYINEHPNESRAFQEKKQKRMANATDGKNKLYVLPKIIIQGVPAPERRKIQLKQQEHRRKRLHSLRMHQMKKHMKQMQRNPRQSINKNNHLARTQSQQRKRQNLQRKTKRRLTNGSDAINSPKLQHIPPKSTFKQTTQKSNSWDAEQEEKIKHKLIKKGTIIATELGESLGTTITSSRDGKIGQKASLGNMGSSAIEDVASKGFGNILGDATSNVVISVARDQIATSILPYETSEKRVEAELYEDVKTSKDPELKKTIQNSKKLKLRRKLKKNKQNIN